MPTVWMKRLRQRKQGLSQKIECNWARIIVIASGFRAFKISTVSLKILEGQKPPRALL